MGGVRETRADWRETGVAILETGKDACQLKRRRKDAKA
jgi:hypothetical protein